MKIAGVIPAKGSSSRVPSKNRQHILNVPLFLWAANNLARVLPRADIYIDSDSSEIRETAAHFGFGTIERPNDLATNATDGNALMLWQASQVDADIYVQHLPPMVFLKKTTLEEAIGAVVSGDHHSAVGLIKSHAYQWAEDDPAYDVVNIPNSFTLPPLITEGMGLYVTRRDALLSERIRIPGPVAPVYLDPYESVDIDYPEDLEFARTLAAGLGPNTPYTEGINGLSTRRLVKLLVLDVDGVMTDGGMYYDEDGRELKKFNTKDGMAIKRARRAGVEIAFLSSGLKPSLIKNRAATLGVEHVYVGTRPKSDVLKEWSDSLSISLEDMAYVGDDINDLNVIDQVGVSACPCDAVAEVKRRVDIVLAKRGGDGCIREFIENQLLGELS